MTGEFWRPHTIEMVDHQTGKSATVTFKNIKFSNGFTDRDFDTNSLKRAR